jgi:hypothetical protein
MLFNMSTEPGENQIATLSIVPRAPARTMQRMARPAGGAVSSSVAAAMPLREPVKALPAGRAGCMIVPVRPLGGR